MRNFRPYKSILIFALLFIAGSIFVFSIYPGVNSNLYLAIATFLVGLFAIYLYIKQQEDERKDAANILLLEIRNAESILYHIRTSGAVSLYTQVLPTNSWSKYNYLFAEDLDRDEFEGLNNFYNQAALVDKFVGQVNALPQQMAAKGEHIQKVLVELAHEFSSASDNSIRKVNYEAKKARFLELAYSEGSYFEPTAPKENMKRAIELIGFITTTTTGAKLKKIARL